MRKFLMLAPLVLIATSSAACDQTENSSSSDIKTRGIWAAIDVIGTSETSVKVRVELRVAGDDGNKVTLDNGDKLVATGGTETKSLQSEDTGVYTATFGAAAAETAYKVDFQRPDDTSAPNSYGTLPAPFTIDPLPTTKPSRATDDLVLKWSGSGSDDIKIRIDGPCIYKWENDNIVQDPGTFTIPKGSIKSTGGENPTECALKVQIIRIRPGSLDPAFGSGYVHLQQTREATFTSAP